MDQFFDTSVFEMGRAEWRALTPYLVLSGLIFLGTVFAGFRLRLSFLRPFSLVLFLAAALGFLIDFGAQVSLFGSGLHVSALTQLVGAASCLFAAIAVLLVRQRGHAEHHPEWFVVLAVHILGLCLLPGARDLISFFVYLECSAIAGYVLVALDPRRQSSLEAGLKYLLNGAFASALFLMGTALMFGAAGAFDYESLGSFLNSEALSDSGRILYLTGAALVVCSLAFKLALVPFHMWAPDVYQAAPTAFASFLAGASKISVFMSFCILFAELGWSNQELIVSFVLAISALSIIVGSLVAWAQTKVRRMLAYSGVANAGFLGLALPIASQSAGSVFLYASIYAVTLIAAFAAVEAIASNLKKDEGDIEISDLAHSHSTWPLWVLGFSIFSIAGIPPLPGFFAKYLLLKDLFLSGQTFSVVLVLIGTLLGLGYYLRVFVPLYFERVSKRSEVTVGVRSVAIGGMLAVVLSVAFLSGLSRLPAWVHSVSSLVR